MPAQITLFLDSILRAEAPGQNGSRNKLDIGCVPTSTLPNAQELAAQIRAASYALADELLAQHKRQQARDRAAAQERHARIIEYAAQHYPSAVALIDPRANRVTPAMRRKLAADGYTPAEIALMAERGELVGTAFFTQPRFATPQRASNNGELTNAEYADLLRRTKQIEL